MKLRPLTILALLLCPHPLYAQGDSSRISDMVVPPRTDIIPKRARPIFEWGDPFLGTGEINEPYVLPTGAVIQPWFLVYGSLRSALSTFDDGSDRTTEWASRLDLFGNLQLSGTERVLIGVRPLDKSGRFTRYTFDSPTSEDEWEGELNARITTLFFEGEFGEIFPNLDSGDRGQLDLGFSVGRQQLTFQDGMLINDSIDAIGITRNNILPKGGSNLRLTGIIGWNEIHRDDRVEDEDALLFGLFGEADYPGSTISLDVVYVNDEGSGNGPDSDAFHIGAGAVQRIGHYNTAFRALISHPVHDSSAAARRGALLFGEVSRSPVHSNDLVYANAFWGIDEFSSAARGPDTGGPLGQTGILYSAVAVGSFGAALGNDAADSLGGALGWQHFFGREFSPRQLIFELGGRADTDGSDRESVAAGFRYQQALSEHTVLRLDGFLTGRNNFDPRSGLRVGIQFKL